MDSWVNDENLFISRRLGSKEGVVQVYRCWCLDTPLGEFSLIGEADSPSTIAPNTAWEYKDYLRLIGFIQVNSVMVNVRGHVILRSEVKYPYVGRPNGPTTYWRCLDLLPLHDFGLVKPVDMGRKPGFLAIDGEVKPAPERVPGEGDTQDWKTMYDNLDETLTACQIENKKLASKIDDWKSVNEQLQVRINAIELERDTLNGSITENKKLVSEINDLKSANEHLQVRLNAIELERQKSAEETEKSKAEVLNLQGQLNSSVLKAVLNNKLEQEMDRWAIKVAAVGISLSYFNSRIVAANTALVKVENLYGRAFDVGSGHYCGSINSHVVWNVYRDGGGVSLISSLMYTNRGDNLVWNPECVCWENQNKTGRLFARFTSTSDTY